MQQNKTKYYHTDLQSFQPQISRYQHKNANNNNQENMSSLQPSKPSRSDTEYFNIAKAKPTNLKQLI